MRNVAGRIIGILAVSILARAGLSDDVAPGIPASADMKAEIVVSGHVSTEKNIEVVNVGTNIPYTYALQPCAVVEGFTGYVSKHFFLRTDYPEDRARFMLELLELAYPYYIEAFGAPPEIESRRIACAYGASYQATTKAMLADGFERGPNGGGEAMFYNGVAYCYPSGNPHHDRYIILHECTHAFQFAAAGVTQGMPGWYIEGMADGLSNHSYDFKHKRLTLFQFNRWGYHNFQASGLADHKANPSWPGGSRGQNVLAVSFLMSDPLRYQKFRVFRDEMFRMDVMGSRIHGESQRLMTELYGDPEALARQFREWVNGTRQVFQSVEGPWQADGGDYVMEDAQNPDLCRIVMDMPPGEPLNDFYGYDLPGPKPTPLAGAVHCGDTEPAIGCVIEFAGAPGDGSLAGFGLGVERAAAEIIPFPEDSLFVDKAATRKGVEVAVYRLRKMLKGGRLASDVVNGARAGKGVDARIGLRLEGSPVTALGLTENFVVEWNGWLKIDTNGPCWFAVRSDDGCWLWIDDRLLVDNGEYREGAIRTGGTMLNAGMHKLRIKYAQGTGASMFEVGLLKGKGLPGCLDLVVADGRSLLVNAEALGGGILCLPLPGDILLSQTGGVSRLGIAAQVGRNKLNIELRAENANPGKPVLRTSMPLTPVQRERLLAMPIVLLARHVSCRLTPYFDAKHPWFDLDEPAPANMWRNTADGEFARTVKACWRLGTNAPASLTAMKNVLCRAALKGRSAQEKALAEFADAREGMFDDIAKIGGSRSRDAIADLSGLTLNVEPVFAADGGILVIVRNPASEPARAFLRLSTVSATGGRDEFQVREFVVPAKGKIEFTQSMAGKDREDDGQLAVDADFEVGGRDTQLRAQTLVKPNPGLTMRFNPSAEVTDRSILTRLVFTGPVQDPAAGTVVIRADPPESVEIPEVTNSVRVASSGTLDIPVLFLWRQGRAPVCLNACARLSAAGEQMKIEASLKIEPGTDSVGTNSVQEVSQ